MTDDSKMCIVCEDFENVKNCQRCQAAGYCSEKCQKKDWPSHKLLCKAFVEQGPRPSPDHLRGILFEVDSPKPIPIWLHFEREDKDDLGFTPHNVNYYKTIEPMILTPTEARARGTGTPTSMMGTTSVVANLRSQHHWGFKWVAELLYRDSFLADGSKPNKAMLAATNPYGPMEHDFRGPVVAAGLTGNETDGATQYCDIDLVQLRMIVDYAVWYKGGVRAKLDRKLEPRTTPSMPS